ncbi:hypothetical protein GJ744_001001 [Endocarpon pusillum]|uniref:Uncharacterized protein n=1 Tax=Endocarpon pusillum TaxID=364733 RepID=A0A8H7AA34_9EURO|nr:hypothetical protein GJ744_001001 [Endocarpon pusillum]
MLYFAIQTVHSSELLWVGRDEARRSPQSGTTMPSRRKSDSKTLQSIRSNCLSGFPEPKRSVFK